MVSPALAMALSGALGVLLGVALVSGKPAAPVQTPLLAGDPVAAGCDESTGPGFRPRIGGGAERLRLSAGSAPRRNGRGARTSPKIHRSNAFPSSRWATGRHMYFLSELRSLARSHGLLERKCRACPPEDWAPTCEACGGSGRVWVAADRVVSDDQLVRLGGPRAHVAAQPSAARS